jgi:hypothetical protein
MPAANVAETTAFNRPVYASPPVGGSASIRLGHGLAPIPTPHSGTFLQALETYGFPYRACKNVVNSRNVRRNKKQKI